MKSKILSKPLPYLALLLAHLIWGANFVVAKVTLQEIPVMSLGFLRFGLACLLIAPFLLTIEKKQQKIKLEHLPRLIGGSVLIVTFNIAFFYYGLARTTAIDASVLSLSVPILSILFGWWFMREKLYLVNFVGTILGLIGAVIIIGLPLFFVGKLDETAFLGNLLIILSSVCFVAGCIIYNGMLKHYPPITATAFTFLVGAVTFFVPAVFEYINNPNWVNQVTIMGMLGLLYIAALSSVSAYFLMIWGFSKIGVTQANLFNYFEPAVAATFAVPFLGERISFSFIIGTCLIVLGVYWGTLGKPEHHHHHHKHNRN